MTNLTTLLIADGKYTLFTYDSASGQPCAKVQTVRGRIVWQYRFKTPESRDKYAVTQCEQLEKAEEKRAEQNETRKQRQNEQVAALKVGDVFYTSWGYDQTNIEYFKIVKISGKRITVKEVYQNTVSTGFDSGNCVPRQDFIKDAKDVIVGICKHGGFQIEGHYAKIWDGKPKGYTFGR